MSRWAFTNKSPKLQRPFSRGGPKRGNQQWRQARSRPGEKETHNIKLREKFIPVVWRGVFCLFWSCLAITLRTFYKVLKCVWKSLNNWCVFKRDDINNACGVNVEELLLSARKIWLRHRFDDLLLVGPRKHYLLNTFIIFFNISISAITWVIDS